MDPNEMWTGQEFGPNFSDDDLFRDDIGKSDDRQSDCVTALLPNFSLLESSSASDKSENQDVSSAGTNSWDEDHVAPETGSHADVVRKKLDVKSRYLSGRSISDAGDRRKRFSKSKYDNLSFEDIEPPEDVVSFAPEKKCFSLPDLISSSKVYGSKGDVSNPPDVTQQDQQDNRTNQSIKSKQTPQDKQKLKNLVEGVSKPKPKLIRTVSFSSKYHVISDEGFDEKMEQNAEDMASDTNSKPSTPISDKGQYRRQVYSESSSGYTGSEGSSQDKQGTSGSFQSQTSQGGVSDASSMFVSYDDESIGNGDESIEDNQNVEKESQNMLEKITAGNNELVDNGVEDAVTLTSNTEVVEDTRSFNSSTGNDADSGSTFSSNSVTTVISVRKTFQESGTGFQDNELPDQSNIDSYTFGGLSVNPGPAAVNKAKDSSFSSQFDGSGSSGGNVPKLDLLDESFTLPPSVVDKVQKDDSLIRKHVVKNYCGIPVDQPAGAQQAAEALHPSSLSDGSNSFQNGPKSRTMQEFERTLRDWNGYDAQDLLHRIQQISSLNSSPSPSPFLPGGRNKSSSSPKLMLSGTDLERASRCSKKNCQDKSCVMVAEVKTILQLDSPRSSPNFNYVNQFCELLWQHHLDCDDFGCKILFCNDLYQWELDDGNVDIMIKLMLQKIKEPFMESLHTAENMIKICDDALKGRKPEDFVTYVPLCVLGGVFGSAKLYMEIETGRHCVVQKHPSFDYKHQLSLYTRLTNAYHPNIAPQLWLLEHQNSIQVCSQFMPGGSLRDLLDTDGGLRWGQIVHYIKQIISAVDYLHDNGVIYLYWISDNILFEDVTRRSVKLSNFSVSYPPGCVCDLGTTKECLPYNICPPELILSEKVEFKSDCWGIGCLVSEMLTCRPVFDDFRHESRNMVHHEITQKKPSIDPKWSPEQKCLLTACWQKKPADRRTVKELLHCLEVPS